MTTGCHQLMFYVCFFKSSSSQLVRHQRKPVCLYCRYSRLRVLCMAMDYTQLFIHYLKRYSDLRNKLVFEDKTHSMIQSFVNLILIVSDSLQYKLATSHPTLYLVSNSTQYNGKLSVPCVSYKQCVQVLDDNVHSSKLKTAHFINRATIHEKKH